MKHKMTIGIVSTLLIVFAGTAGAHAEQAIPADISLMQGMGDTQYHRLESVQADHTYHIFVRLPEGYAASGNQTYPTIYLLDGGITYPLLSSYYRYLTLGEEIPEAILVGIAYGTVDWENGNSRGTDFTAASAEREHYGGAPRFQKMFSQELLPLIEKNYRARADRRIIFGQSLGGQFVLYTALTQPTLFWGHIASNPALHRNLPFFLQDAAIRPGSPEQSRLFVSSGSNDELRFRGPALKWMGHWIGQTSMPWALKTVTLEGHGHFSAAPVAFRQGVRWLFSEGDVGAAGKIE